MNFTTPISVKPIENKINYQSEILLLGSCFSENMGEKFIFFKFNALVNPFGIIFNAVSLEKLVERVVNKKYFTEDDIFFYNDGWHCFEVHSQLSDIDEKHFLEKLNKIVELTHLRIGTLTHCLITLGTSWVYKHLETNEIVANCYKLPQNLFEKKLLSADENFKAIQNIIQLIESINPKVNFIFTISPVRHVKDGFFENNVSKANLFSALFQNHPSSFIHQLNYFPSYEIMVDELRDYRFYAEDMLHPNQLAIDHIWIKFFENYINENEFAAMNQVCEIQRALKHKSFNENSESHLKFLNNLKQKIITLKKIHPDLKF